MYRVVLSSMLSSRFYTADDDDDVIFSMDALYFVPIPVVSRFSPAQWTLNLGGHKPPNGR